MHCHLVDVPGGVLQLRRDDSANAHRISTSAKSIVRAPLTHGMFHGIIKSNSLNGIAIWLSEKFASAITAVRRTSMQLYSTI